MVHEGQRLSSNFKLLGKRIVHVGDEWFYCCFQPQFISLGVKAKSFRGKAVDFSAPYKGNSRGYFTTAQEPLLDKFKI